MSKQSAKPASPTVLPTIHGTREDAKAKIAAQVAKGEELKALPVRNPADLDAMDEAVNKWRLYTRDLLVSLFSTDEMASDFNRAVLGGGGILIFAGGPRSLQERLRDTQKEITSGINSLHSITERLDLYKEGAAQGHSQAPALRSPSSKVFIVHGTDEAVKHEVARFVDKIGLIPVILSEQTNGGQTIIEKFEQHASEAGFAVVLMTADDHGKKCEEEPSALKTRARQNVVLELGYFYGRLGRKHVAVIHKGVEERPSDIQGIVYLPYEGDWKLALAKEIKTLIPAVDMNQAL